MEDIYTSGQYLETTKTWHSEDSQWKAGQIKKILDKNLIHPISIAEIGCGSGAIINELSMLPDFHSAIFEGYDISSQAIELAKQLGNKRIEFYQEDLLLADNEKKFDILMVIDVFEHVPDYMGFVEKCKAKAEYKIFHIPLDLHVSSVLRNSFIRGRYTVGHLHYFTADHALSVLRDAGHEIIDSFYTQGSFGVFGKHPKLKTAIANVPRWLFSKFSLPLSARIFGGYSLLVLTK